MQTPSPDPLRRLRLCMPSGSPLSSSLVDRGLTARGSFVAAALPPRDARTDGAGSESDAGNRQLPEARRR